MTSPRYRSLGDAVRADVGRAIAIATFACIALAITEYVAALIAYTGSTPVLVKLRLVAVVASLAALIWLPAVAVVVARVVAPRIARRLAGRDALGPGALSFPAPTRHPRPGPARLWAGLVIGGVAIGALQRWAFHVDATYKEKQLAAAMIAIVAVLALPVAYAGYRATARGLDWLAREVDPVLGRWSPIGRWRGAVLALFVLAIGTTYAAWRLWPAARSAWAAVPLDQFQLFPPWRTLIPLTAMILGGAYGSRRGSIAAPRRTAAAIAATALAVVPLSLFRWGADYETKMVAVTASPTLARVVNALRRVNDLDGDGFGSLLGENDCAPFDPARHPGARDIPDNGLDENCDGRDFSLRDLARPAGDPSPVPLAFRRPWNVLLLTVDTVRYDHTSFGGYLQTKRRDTTPRLAELVERAVSFSFAQAPSAGTMASIPAILTSKFFHSGIALDETKKPPKLKPENLLIGEIMKGGGYTTGAITSHEYFKDWGMDQGMDSYDNELGKDGDPYKITSSLITDRALAWISRQHDHKWFLWAHYIDPHGRYVAHPDSPSYGATEEDLYDGELRYTDHHLGRLLDELARLPGGDQTIVVITSDHGDGFNEHGFINHGQALYRELIHVPLIVAVPNNPARRVGGAVSAVDVLPTIAELCGIDVSQHAFEGVSLVPQIFHGTEDPARVVFAETNYPEPIRAAISARQKLIYRLRGNLYELYDLTADPWEKTNLWPREAAAGAAIKDALDRWIERVLYSRDPVFNQAAAKISAVMMHDRPTPPAASAGVTFDGGRIAVLGAGFVDPTRAFKPGDTVEVYFYFEVLDTPTKAYKLQILGWPAQGPGFDPAAAMPPGTLRSAGRETLDGLFGSDRWRKGELIRDKFQLKLPTAWSGDLAVGLGVYVASVRAEVIGPHPGGDAAVTTLGVLPLQQVMPVPPPPPRPGPGSQGAPRP